MQNTYYHFHRKLYNLRPVSYTHLDVYKRQGEYKEAYVIEQKKLALETAQEAYDVAKAIYDTALAQVKSVLETLSK